MNNNDLIFAIGRIDDELIEASEKTSKQRLKAKTGLLIAAVLILAFSVTAVAAASFFNTVRQAIFHFKPNGFDSRKANRLRKIIFDFFYTEIVNKHIRCDSDFFWFHAVFSLF